MQEYLMTKDYYNEIKSNIDTLCGYCSGRFSNCKRCAVTKMKATAKEEYISNVGLIKAVTLEDIQKTLAGIDTDELMLNGTFKEYLISGYEDKPDIRLGICYENMDLRWTSGNFYAFRISYKGAKNTVQGAFVKGGDGFKLVTPGKRNPEHEDAAVIIHRSLAMVLPSNENAMVDTIRLCALADRGPIRAIRYLIGKVDNVNDTCTVSWLCGMYRDTDIGTGERKADDVERAVFNERYWSLLYKFGIRKGGDGKPYIPGIEISKESREQLINDEFFK